MTPTDTPDPDTDPALDPKAARPAPPTDGAGDSPEPPPSDPDSHDAATRPVEIGGQKGPEPTRYGDWEKKGRCTDF